MAEPRSLLGELRRRSIPHVLVIYLVASWGAFEVVTELTDVIGLPAWVPGMAVVLFVIGLPIILATAFVQGGGPLRARAETPDAEAPTEAAPQATRRAAPGAPTLPTPTAGTGATPHWLTWRRALAGGALAFVGLGAGTAGYMGMRVLGIGPPGTLIAQGALDADQPIVLADFASASDSTLGGTITEALRIDLAQSTTVTVADAGYIAEVLDLMRRDRDTQLTAEVAREVAEREGFGAVLEGEVSPLGTGYVVAARLVAPDGRLLAGFRESAAGDAELIGAVDRLSKQIREKVGEGLRSVRAAEPLAQVSTSSLPALRKYTQAMRVLERTGDNLRVVELVEEAVALDSTFAMAWRRLAHSTRNVNANLNRARQVEAFTRAFELRERLGERERLYVEADYHGNVRADRRRAMQARHALLDAYPNEVQALNTLGNNYRADGDRETAETLYRRGIATGQRFRFLYVNLASVLFELGRPAEARATLAELAAIDPENQNNLTWPLRFAAAEGDYATADSLAGELARRHRGSTQAEAAAAGYRLDIRTVQGQLRAGEQFEEELDRLWSGLNAQQTAYGKALYLAQRTLYLRGDEAGARRLADSIQTAVPLEEMDPLERPYLTLARLYANLGEPDRAAEFIEAWESHRPADYTEENSYGLPRLRGLIAAGRGDYDTALRQLRLADEQDRACRICVEVDLGRVHEAAGRPDSAIAAFERYVETSYFARLGLDGYFLAPTLERLARLHELQGNAERAREYNLRFAALWADADPEFQPRVRAALEGAERVGGGRR